MLLEAQTLTDGAAEQCRYALQSLACFRVWAFISTPFTLAGGIYSLMALRRLAGAANSQRKLYMAMVLGFLYAFASATLFSYAFEYLGLSSGHAWLDLASMLAFVLLMQALYVKLSRPVALS